MKQKLIKFKDNIKVFALEKYLRLFGRDLRIWDFKTEKEIKKPLKFGYGKSDYWFTMRKK